MKFFLTISLVTLSFFSEGQRNADILHYRFEIDVNDRNDSIFGIAEISARMLASDDKLILHLKDINADGRGMHVKKVSGASGYKRVKDELVLTFDRKYSVGDTAKIKISYYGIPADGLIISKNKYNQRTFFSDNWPDRARNWLPCYDDPIDKAAVDFVITAPEHYQVVSNGMQIEESNIGNGKKLTHWRETVPLPTKIMVVGIANFAVQHAGMVNGHIPVSSWVYPQDRDKGFYDYALATSILDWFIEKIGPYAYQKLANVQSKTIFGGMENASAIFYSESSVSGNRRSEALIAHEIAHQWFGNMATEKSFAHLWLSEGFATYLTTLYMKEKYGTDTMYHMLDEDRQQVIAFSRRSNMPVVDPETTNYMDLLNANSYQKGGWVLRMLHNKLGDSLFMLGIRRYYEKYAGANADTDDLRRVLEEVSGKDLKSFFQQWLYTKGHPVISYQWKFDANKKEIILSVQQHQQKIFSFPLEIAMQHSNGKLKTERIEISSAKQEFRLPADTKPALLNLDPDRVLLFEEK